MGMYTGLRMRGQLKEKAISLIKTLYNIRGADRWIVTQMLHLNFDLKEFCKFYNCDFISFGGISIYQWDENDPDWVNHVTDFGYWVFQCSLKNYENQIQCFLETVALQLFETCDHCEELYCEFELSTLYALENGKFIKKREQRHDICNHIGPYGMPLHDSDCPEIVSGYQSNWMKFFQKAQA